MTKQYYLDPSYFFFLASAGPSAAEARRDLKAIMKQGATLFSSTLALIQLQEMLEQVGMEKAASDSILDEFDELCAELIPFERSHWQKGRALSAEKGLPIYLCCHAAIARDYGVSYIYTRSSQYRKIPGIVALGLS